jgi:hemerythrin-like domain-containing protein
MIPQALRIIQEEHQALSAMLLSLSMLVRRARQDRQPPPFDVLRAMLFYVDEFPERQHHPKETQLLFPKLRHRCPELAPVLDQLNDEHARGEASVRELQHRLLAWELLGEPRREAFEGAAQRFVERYLQHMSLEETTILPAARRDFDALDWADLDAAFAANRDMLAGHGEPDGEYAPLFKLIVQTAPAPIGLG